MEVWTLETENDFTPFYFPLEEDKTFFHELVENHFENAIRVADKWHPVFMLRGEPKKHPDFFAIDGTDVIAMSQAAVDTLKDLFKPVVELLPMETDAGKYYALNIVNFVDCLDKTNSKYLATKNGAIVKYSSLEFDEDKLGENTIFKIPELPYQLFITNIIRDECEAKELKGLLLDIELSLVWEGQ